MSNINDFQIKDGALIKYAGSEKCVKIPEGVTAIENFAFRDCTEVEYILFPASVASIGHYAISGCCRLEVLEVVPGNDKDFSRGNCVIDADRRELVLGCCASVIPDDGTVTSIAQFAFAGCVALDRITVPSAVKRIWDYAFDGCYNLEKIELAEGVEYIGCSVFDGCEALESITIPDTVTYIADYAFSGCCNLCSFTAGEELCGFGVDIFRDCGEELTVFTPPEAPIRDYAARHGIRIKAI